MNFHIILKKNYVPKARGWDVKMSVESTISEQQENKIIAEILELQRLYYYENKNKETERGRKLRDVIDRATPLTSV